jgi:hypothetical protein
LSFWIFFLTIDLLFGNFFEKGDDNLIKTYFYIK